MHYKLKQNLAFAGFEAIRENVCVIINICEFAHFEAHFWISMLSEDVISWVRINPAAILKSEVQNKTSNALASNAHEAFHKISYTGY